MKLLKITDEVYIQPAHVTSVVIDNDLSDKRTGEERFCIVISCDEDKNYVCTQSTRVEAEGFLEHIVARINEALKHEV